MEINNNDFKKNQTYITKIIRYLIDNNINSDLNKNQLRNFQKFNNKLLGNLNFQKKPRNVRVNYFNRKMIQDNLLNVNDYHRLLNITLGKNLELNRDYAGNCSN